MNSTPFIVFICSMALIFFSLALFLQLATQAISKFWTYLAWASLTTSLPILFIHFSIARSIPIWLMSISLTGTLNVYLGNQLPKLHLKLTATAGVLSIVALMTTAGVHWL